MKPEPLYTTNNTHTNLWRCGECQERIYKTRESAEYCCKPLECKRCGTEVPHKDYHLLCKECRVKQEEEREAERFAKVEKVTEWDGWIFTERHGGGGEDYFQHLEDLRDNIACYADPGAQMPPYVWTCDSTQFVNTSVGQVIDNIMESEECYEEFDSSDICGVKELEAAIDAFNEVNAHHLSYSPNFRRALIVDQETWHIDWRDDE